MIARKKNSLKTHTIVDERERERERESLPKRTLTKNERGKRTKKKAIQKRSSFVDGGNNGDKNKNAANIEKKKKHNNRQHLTANRGGST